MPVIVFPVQGLAVTLVGSILILVVSVVDFIVPHVVTLIGQITQVGQIIPTSPAFVGVIGIVVGFVTAIGGIVIQVYDRLNARRRADQEYRVRYYLVRKNHREIAKYSRDLYKYVMEIRTMCETAGVRIPFDLGPPPIPIGGSPEDSDDNVDGIAANNPAPKS